MGGVSPPRLHGMGPMHAWMDRSQYCPMLQCSNKICTVFINPDAHWLEDHDSINPAAESAFNTLKPLSE